MTDPVPADPAPPEPRVVRVTMWPDRDIEVTEQEHLGLHVDGLLMPGYDPPPPALTVLPEDEDEGALSGDAADPDPAPAAAPAPTTKSARRPAADAASKEN